MVPLATAGGRSEQRVRLCYDEGRTEGRGSATMDLTTTPGYVPGFLDTFFILPYNVLNFVVRHSAFCRFESVLK